MQNPMVYAKCAIVRMWLKIRYGSSLKMGRIQSFEHLRLQIARGGSADMGSYNQNRERLYIGVLPGAHFSLGNHCFFNINSSITCCESVTIGDNCKFGNNLVIVDHDHNFRKKEDRSGNIPEFVSSPVRIGNNVWVGANVTILRGTEIGDDCVIGAGTTVKGTIPPGSMVRGKVSDISELTE